MKEGIEPAGKLIDSGIAMKTSEKMIEVSSKLESS